MSRKIPSTLPESLPLWMLAAVIAVFSILSPPFLQPRNLLNILVQSASLTIVSVGMTFVLLTAGIDLAVGSVMLLAAVCAGKLALAGGPLVLACAAALSLGTTIGLLNGLLVAQGTMLAFIVTLAALYIGRGLGLFITQTRAMNLPAAFSNLGSGKLFGIPFPAWVLIVVLLTAHWILTRTAFGRQLYAVGASARAASRAGIPVQSVTIRAYVISGFCAAVGGLVAIAQLGAVSPTFGNGREFDAIAAAVLGGVSLFGGRGRVFPGAWIGAVLIQTVENGLVMMNANPYVHPLVTAAVVFTAVLLDTFRTAQVRSLQRRKIRPMEALPRN